MATSTSKPHKAATKTELTQKKTLNSFTNMSLSDTVIPRNLHKKIHSPEDQGRTLHEASLLQMSWHKSSFRPERSLRGECKYWNTPEGFRRPLPAVMGMSKKIQSSMQVWKATLLKQGWKVTPAWHGWKKNDLKKKHTEKSKIHLPEDEQSWDPWL